ncbi:MAG: KH domain-containing protein [Anaerolineae bacterium]|nr:KH domain-containing protein [Anaerolineae bacterium]MDW8299993.1 KH domain-containing protein [Anaerolineae bacterium]
MKELVEYVAKSLVENPSAVRVTERLRRGTLVIELHVAPSDMGRVIGKEGRIANALRALLRVAAARSGRRVVLDIS